MPLAIASVNRISDKNVYLPLVVVLELTRRCNMQCEHCGSDAGGRRDGELSSGRFLRLCDELAEALCREVTLSGGEPLLRRDWTRVASRLHDNGIRVKLISNGFLLNQANLDKALANGVGSICVSVDGTEEIHNRIRGTTRCFLHILRAFRDMRRLGLPIHVVTTVSRRNLVCLSTLFDFLTNEGVHYWQLQLAMPYGRMAQNTALLLAREEHLALARLIADFRRRGKKLNMTVQAGHNMGYGCELSDTIRSKKWVGCPAGLFVCGIESNGNVKGCLSMQHPSFVEGNLKEECFWDIWFDESSFPYNRRFDLAQLPEACRQCRQVMPCLGGCRSLAQSVSLTRGQRTQLCLAETLLTLERGACGSGALTENCA